VESGRKHPSFRGSRQKFYQKYKEFSEKQNLKPFGWRIFHQLREKNRVHVFAGDQYTDPKWIKLRKLLKQQQKLLRAPTTDNVLQKLQELSIEILPLQEHHDAANWMREQFRLDIENLKTDLESMVVVVDFTKWNQVPTGNVHSLVIVVCQGEVQENGTVIVKRHYYDCISQKTADTPVKQTFAYVKTAFLELYQKLVFAKHKKVSIWGDGGPGHFKVYKTQRWMSSFQQETKGAISWDWNCFLPYRGHNLCDGHAGCAKRKVREQEKNYQLTESMDDICQALSSLSNTTVIELEGEVILQNDEPVVAVKGQPGFIKNYFHFEYPAENSIFCQHLKHQGK
jgi:hypothetical protein